MDVQVQLVNGDETEASRHIYRSEVGRDGVYSVLPGGLPLGGRGVTVPIYQQDSRKTDNDWPEVHQNIGKARSEWRRLRNIMQWEGADNHMSALFYMDAIHAVLLFG